MFIRPENQDKAKHILVSAALSVLFFPFLGFLGAIGASVIIGAAKEVLWDKLLGKGTPDINDFYADIAGALGGAFLCAMIGTQFPAFWPSVLPLLDHCKALHFCALSK